VLKVEPHPPYLVEHGKYSRVGVISFCLSQIISAGIPQGREVFKEIH
jgi:hypothetical protein